MGTTAGELRELLIEAIDQVKAGKMEPADAAAIAKLAGQVTLSMQVELNAKRDALLPPKAAIGSMPLGNDNIVDL